jgi:hypothetical protein
MSTQFDDTNQFHIPSSQPSGSQPQFESGQVQNVPDQGAYWTKADAEIAGGLSYGENILSDHEHDPQRWTEAMLSRNDRLGLSEAEADVERRQREVDFNERARRQAEREIVRRGLAAINEVEAQVLPWRSAVKNDDGMVNGVKAA